jgi:multicomponent Na+:H+ antiporter subunit E
MRPVVLQIFKIISFLFFYIWEVLMANIKMAYIILSPKPGIKPAIICIPLETQSDFEIALLVNLITMTPGSLSMDISTDRKTVYVHVMDNTDPTTVKNVLQEGLQKKVKGLFK